ARERVARIAPAFAPALFGPVPRWSPVPRWLPPQSHNVPERFRPPGQRNARSQSRSTPVAVAPTGPGASRPIVGAEGASSSGFGCARSGLARPPEQRHTPASAFFFTTAHCGILAFKFATHPLLGLGCPLVHAGIAQETHFLNQQFF